MAREPVASLRSKEYDALRQLLREIRESAGMTQSELSLKLGRPKTYIGKVELGTRRLDVVEFYAITSILSRDFAAIAAEFKQRLKG